jgi:hypothetical protein
MEWYLLWKVGLVFILTELMDLCSFYRKREKGYVSIHQKDTRDLWHDSKKVLLFFVYGELVEWNVFLLIIAILLNWFFHEFIFFHGWFKKFINNEE